MLYPMFAMVLFTLVIGIIALKTRIASVKAREISPAYFQLMQGKSEKPIPERVQVTTRALNNQFEVPVLFYVIATVSLALDQVTTLSIAAAWLFILSRVVHSWIHLTYNNVLHRMAAFWVGLLLVLTLWIEQVILST